jgi:hypothetical protein
VVPPLAVVPPAAELPPVGLVVDPPLAEVVLAAEVDEPPLGPAVLDPPEPAELDELAPPLFEEQPQMRSALARITLRSLVLDTLASRPCLVGVRYLGT